jgi:catechol 2,3-dioxygenase
MVGVKKLERAKLGVMDVGAAVEFYTDALGLNEIARKEGVVYLGCGYDDRYDIAIEAGDTGVEHFSVRVPDRTVIEAVTDSLASEGVRVDELPGDQFGREQAIRFDLPTGITITLVTMEPSGYVHASQPTELGRAVQGPVDLDHITLLSMDLEKDATFLRDVVGFDISDVRTSRQGVWQQAFLRRGDYHHDVAMIAADDHEVNLHHLAWRFVDINHLKLLVDHLAATGNELEVGIGRHHRGSNIFSYLWSQGGNRMELTTEMATLDEDTPTTWHEGRDEDAGLSAWGGIIPPDSFIKEGS